MKFQYDVELRNITLKPNTCTVYYLFICAESEILLFDGYRMFNLMEGGGGRVGGVQNSTKQKALHEKVIDDQQVNQPIIIEQWHFNFHFDT